MALARRQRLTIELALLVLVAFLAALGTSTALRTALDDIPPAPAITPLVSPAVPPPLADYAVIAERDLFNPAAGPPAAGRPQHRLLGVGFQGHEARAVIEETATGRQMLYRVGDDLDGARVATIGWDRVTLTGPAGEATLELAPPEERGRSEAAPEPAPVSREARIRQTGERAFIVDRRELAGAGENMSGLLTQLRAVAEVQDGRAAGFRLFQIRDGSLLARLGLHDGDVVQRVNGTAVAEPAALLGFLARLEHEPRVALDIVRGDTPQTLVYDLR